MDQQRQVRSTRVPETVLPHLLLRRVDLSDAYEADLPPGSPADAEHWARRIFHQPPPWVLATLALRNAVVAPFALKRPTKESEGFPVLGRSDNEVVLGLDDRHLDFRVSVLTHPTAGGHALTVATRVLVHGGLGRAYIAVVWPVHPFVVRAMIRRALAE